MLLYVGAWLYFRLRPYMLLRKDARLPIGTVEKYHAVGSTVRRLGLFAVFLFPLPFMLILPEVEVFSRQSERSGWDHYPARNGAVFYVKHAYVPFCYNGKVCAPCGKYVCNETDSSLVLYPATFYNGAYAGAISDKSFITVRPHTLRPFGKGISYRFRTPQEKQISTYVQDRYKNKFVTDWTIDTPQGATAGMNEVNNEVESRAELIKKVLWKL